MNSHVKLVALWLTLAMAYFIAAKLGLSLAFEQANTSPVWPPTGISIAALLYFDFRATPGIFLGALLANLATGLSAELSLLIAFGNSSEAVCALVLCRLFVAADPFTNIGDISRFVLIVLLASCVSASIGALSLVFGDVIGWPLVTLIWTTWWLGDVVGGILLTPLIFALINSSRLEWKALYSPRALILLLVTLLITSVVFSGWFSFSTANYPLAFTYLPLAIWAAYRFHNLGASIFVICVASFSIYGTLLGFGPFHRDSANESLLLLQGFMAVMMVTTLVLAASVKESDKAKKELFKNKNLLEQLVKKQTGDLQIATKELSLAESVFNESSDSIVITDREANVLRVNPAFSRMTGYSEDDVLGKTPHFLTPNKLSQEFYLNFWQTLNKEHSWQGELWDTRKNGESYPTWQTMTAVADKQGNLIQYISIFSDISEKKINEERINHLAHFDALTDLNNRVAFHQQLEKAITYADRQKYKLSLLYIDLDNFKLINDASGHPVGDLLLKHFAERFKQSVREEDSIARLGGDEFVILIVDVHEGRDAALVANKILQEMAKPIMLEHTEVVVTGSIGISTYPDDAPNADELLKNADIAMYKAKQKGRNTFQFFTSEMNAQAEERLSLENDIRKGLVNDEFVLHYQPQLDLSTGKVIGCEALIRWNHPNKGLIPPNVFIPIAEESGLIRELGHWVMRTACVQQTQWKDSSLAVAVNISGRQFLSQQLINEVQTIIVDTGIDPNCLELELTESIIMEYVEENIVILEKLHQMGVKLSVDDFGTGYSSMSYLKRFPIDKLKIDQSFVKDIVIDSDDAAIVKAVTRLGQSLNLKVIAEGVETKDQLQFLRDIGCDEMQGYFFCYPLSSDDLAEFLGKANQ
jgi:diguanylate cyclase (GGDEF)-like protein/PAS domain S-box-containing protein